MRDEHDDERPGRAQKAAVQDLTTIVQTVTDEMESRIATPPPESDCLAIEVALRKAATRGMYIGMQALIDGVNDAGYFKADARTPVHLPSVPPVELPDQWLERYGAAR